MVKLILRWLLSWRSTKLSVKPLLNTCLGRDAQNLFSFFIFWQTPISDFCCFERESKTSPVFLEKCTFQSWEVSIGLGGCPLDILQLRPLTVFPILDEFPMPIVQSPLLSSDVRKLAKREIKALQYQIYRTRFLLPLNSSEYKHICQQMIHTT